MRASCQASPRSQSPSRDGETPSTWTGSQRADPGLSRKTAPLPPHRSAVVGERPEVGEILPSPGAGSGLWVLAHASVSWCPRRDPCPVGSSLCSSSGRSRSETTPEPPTQRQPKTARAFWRRAAFAGRRPRGRARGPCPPRRLPLLAPRRAISAPCGARAAKVCKTAAEKLASG